MRLLDATFAVIAEQGYRRMAARKVAERAGVSSKTFYDLFTDRKDCFLAALDHAVEEQLGPNADFRLTVRIYAVLVAAGEHFGLSNREVSDVAGVCDQGQISKLLARLQRLGLLENSGEGQPRGESNAWRLTPLGERITEQLALDTDVRPDGEA